MSKIGSKLSNSTNWVSCAAKLGALASVLIFSNVSWAGNGACSTTATLASYAPQGPGSGCYDVDQTFSNFSVTDNSTVGTTQTTSTNNIGAVNNFSAIATPWSENSVFTPTVGAWNATGSGVLGGTINYLTDSQQGLMTDPVYQNPSPGSVVNILTASLSASGLSGNDSGDGMIVTEIVCIGTGTCIGGATGNEITFLETFGQNSSAPLLSCAAASNANATCSGGVATFTTTVSQLNITDIYSESINGTNGSVDQLFSFTNDFNNGETAPEPSTFVLIGTALAGLGILRRRKKA